MNVGLYKLKIGEVNQLKFYRKIGDAEIEKQVPEITAKDWDGEEAIFIFDAEFSKEVGHYAYVKTDTRKGHKELTPFIPDALPDGNSKDASTASQSGDHSLASGGSKGGRKTKRKTKSQ